MYKVISELLVTNYNSQFLTCIPNCQHPLGPLVHSDLSYWFCLSCCLSFPTLTTLELPTACSVFGFLVCFYLHIHLPNIIQLHIFQCSFHTKDFKTYISKLDFTLTQKHIIIFLSATYTWFSTKQLKTNMPKTDFSDASMSLSPSVLSVVFAISVSGNFIIYFITLWNCVFYGLAF